MVSLNCETTILTICHNPNHEKSILLNQNKKFIILNLKLKKNVIDYDLVLIRENRNISRISHSVFNKRIEIKEDFN